MIAEGHADKDVISEVSSDTIILSAGLGVSGRIREGILSCEHALILRRFDYKI
jgi:hypothetical protein